MAPESKTYFSRGLWEVNDRAAEEVILLRFDREDESAFVADGALWNGISADGTKEPRYYLEGFVPEDGAEVAGVILLKGSGEFVCSDLEGDRRSGQTVFWMRFVRTLTQTCTQAFGQDSRSPLALHILTLSVKSGSSIVVRLFALQRYRGIKVRGITAISEYRYIAM